MSTKISKRYKALSGKIVPGKGASTLRHFG